MKKLFISLTVALLSVTASFANTSDLELPTEENNAKLVKMIKEADANDYITYTDAARLAVNWNGDLELAKEWVNHALSIQENSLSLEVLGDYYVRTGQVEKAATTYLTAIEKGIKKIDQEDMNRLQRKALVYARK
ncbi:hypothetical protein [Flammeovirga sp. SubArs3]|uniref:hypothetical protein n=1 Tax=Flammeovirga sp. SubArs3 TaxID=2995316 RepID=UPI00248B277B|nr:hypothetical protein [Flammeovirga sp. SubArs3]